VTHDKPQASAKSADDRPSSAPVDGERLRALERFARWSDSGIRLPGTPWTFGWDALIGLIPGIGDVAGVAMSGYVFEQGRRLGVSKTTLVRMAANIAVDFVVGSIPVIGDLFDFGFKANQRNLELIQLDVGRRTP
jgi:uncharacterized protein DUF4112